jgi:hypothetical protein
MKTWLRLVLVAWWVVTYQGRHVAGPFTLLQECQDAARCSPPTERG